MDILGDLEGSRTLTGYRCAMHQLRKTNPELAEQAQRGIDSTISSRLVSDWLRRHGAEISDQVIRNHRVGRCVTCLTTS